MIDFPAFPAPVAACRPTSRVVHGVTLTDAYDWIRAANWQEVLREPALLPADIRALLEAENTYCDAALAPAAELRATLLAEMRARIKEEDSSVPDADGAFAYFVRYRQGGEHPQIGRMARGGGNEVILIDGEALSQGKAFFQFGGGAHSPDHRLHAWACDEAGSEYYTIRVRDWATGTDIADSIPDTSGRMVWTQDSSGLLYIRLDENHRPTRIFLHRLGQPVADDVLIYEETTPGWFAHLSGSRFGRHALIETGDSETSEAYLLDLADVVPHPQLIEPRQHGVRYDVLAHRDRLYIRTDAGGATDYRLLAVPYDDLSRTRASEIVPHRPGVYLADFDATADFLIRLERADALPRIVIREISSGDEHSIAFDEDAYALMLREGLEFTTDTLRFVYSSMTTPSETWDYDMRRRTRVLRKRQEIPSGHEAANYITRRIQAPAHDGALVPVTLLYHRDTPLDGSAPCLLYGYGSYGAAMPAGFSSNRLSLVDRGFIFAIAHVRGGSDKGWGWYLDGKKLKKQNTFSDFISCARDLIARGLTREKRIVAHGGSAGGMLMGVVANQAPELFAGIVADVPFVDVVNTILDDTLPLTPPEWEEWGNPITDPAAFAAMLAYSPYDNVTAQDYPPILAIAGLTDPRVTYWEPAKWVARLRATMTGGGPILLQTNMAAGHGGAPGQFSQLDEIAVVYSFAILATGTDAAPAA